MAKVCGIYKITSPSGRVYIGQSINIVARWRTYENLNLSNKEQKILYASLKKYKPNKHIFEIIEECLEEDLNCAERYWQDFYDVLNGGLNLVLQECGDKRKVESEATRKLRSSNNKGERNPFYGKTHSEETIEKLSKSTIKQFEENPELRQYLKEKFSGGIYHTPAGDFLSSRDAAKANNISRGSLRSWCMKNSDKKVGYNYQIPQKYRGEKTWREHGFYFTPKENNE